MASILAAGVAPFVITKAGVLMPVKKILSLEESGLFTGALGNYEGVTFFPSSPIAAKLWSKHLFEVVTRESYLMKILKNEHNAAA